MAQRRISRGTPLILSETEVEQTINALTPKVEQAIAHLLGKSVEEWRQQTKRVRVRQINEFQNTGALAASLVAAHRATADLELAAMPDIAQITTDTAVVEAVIETLHARGMIIANPATHQETSNARR